MAQNILAMTTFTTSMLCPSPIGPPRDKGSRKMPPDAFWPGLFMILAVVILVLVATVGSYFGYKMWLTAKGWEIWRQNEADMRNHEYLKLQLAASHASSVETDPPRKKKPVCVPPTSEPLPGSVEPDNASATGLLLGGPLGSSAPPRPPTPHADGRGTNKWKETMDSLEKPDPALGLEMEEF